MKTQPSPITPEELTRAADLNYDLGRKHRKDELLETCIEPLISALKQIDKLSCNCPCMSLQAQRDFDNHPEAMAYKVELAKVILEIRDKARAALAKAGGGK